MVEIAYRSLEVIPHILVGKFGSVLFKCCFSTCFKERCHLYSHIWQDVVCMCDHKAVNSHHPFWQLPPHLQWSPWEPGWQGWLRTVWQDETTINKQTLEPIIITQYPQKYLWEARRNVSTATATIDIHYSMPRMKEMCFPQPLTSLAGLYCWTFVQRSNIKMLFMLWAMKL